MMSPAAPELAATAPPPADASDAYQALLDDATCARTRQGRQEDMAAFAAYWAISTPAAASAWLVTLEPQGAEMVFGGWIEAMQAEELDPELTIRRVVTLHRLYRLARRPSPPGGPPPMDPDHGSETAQ